MEKAVMTVHKMSANEQTREIARLREDALHIAASNLGAVMDKGRAEGIDKGKEIERTNILNTMRKEGLDEEIIRRILNI